MATDWPDDETSEHHSFGEILLRDSTTLKRTRKKGDTCNTPLIYFAPYGILRKFHLWQSGVSKFTRLGGARYRTITLIH